MDHDLNVIGALAVVLGDRIRDATEEAGGMGGALPAALAALHEWAGGHPIETLAAGLRLSHSRTVRVVDKLEAKGLATRARDPADGRIVLVHLTPAGHRAGVRVLEARAAALEDAIDPRDCRALAALAERALARATTSRRAAGAICRLCDARACGHHEGRCPVTQAADAAAAAQRWSGQSGGGSGSSPSWSQTRCSMS
jgi:DNA-binding MarR family transcriptional regulator